MKETITGLASSATALSLFALPGVLGEMLEGIAQAGHTGRDLSMGVEGLESSYLGFGMSLLVGL